MEDGDRWTKMKRAATSCVHCLHSVTHDVDSLHLKTTITVEVLNINGVMN